MNSSYWRHLLGILAIAILAGCARDAVTATFGVTAIWKAPDGNVLVDGTRTIMRSAETGHLPDGSGGTGFSTEIVEGTATLTADAEWQSSSEEAGTLTVTMSGDSVTVAARPSGDTNVGFDVTFSDGTTRGVELAVGKSVDVFVDGQSLGVRIHLRAR